MSSMPRACSTASVSNPTGPAPVISTRSPGATPETFIVCKAIAVGSVSAAARSGSSAGIGRRRAAGTTT